MQTDLRRDANQSQVLSPGQDVGRYAVECFRGSASQVPLYKVLDGILWSNRESTNMEDRAA
jgi:hypothetical protein